MRDLERASAGKPNDPLVLLELGHAYLHKQDYADARRVFQRAVEIDSEDAEAEYGLGFAWLKLGQAGQAIAPLEKAAQLDPKNVALEQVLAEAYRAENRPADAQAASDKADQLRRGRTKTLTGKAGNWTVGPDFCAKVPKWEPGLGPRAEARFLGRL